MKLASFGPSVVDYDLDLEYYHGKDIVHEGSLLVLDPVKAWPKISSNTRKNINRAKRLTNLRIDKVAGNKEDVKKFRTVWFNPEDPTIPAELEPDEIMYLAYLDGRLVAGMILTPVGNNLFLHNLGGNDEAKKNSVTSFLLWNAVEELQNSAYGYIDIGVSFRKSLQTYFGHWRTEKYPIIFSPPFLKPMISLSPFEAKHISVYKNGPDQPVQQLEKYFGKEFTILPRAIYCIRALLEHLDIKKDENVAIYKTLDNDYISRCVTETISSRCNYTRQINSKTKAVMVIHEFGYPYKDLKKLRALCDKKGLPLIENCAWGYGSQVDGKEVGSVGDYAIYSLPKFLPMAHGGVLKGLTISDEDNWQTFKLLDFYKREAVVTQLLEEMPKLAGYNQQRLQNWHYLKQLFELAGHPPLIELDPDVYPSVFMVKLKDAQKMYERYLNFGVETGRYYPEEALFLPTNHALGQPQLDYVYGVYQGYLNLCSEYQRKDQKVQ